MLAESDRCTGCCACEQSCQVKAITMEAGSGGFLYPHINEDKCISCGDMVKLDFEKFLFQSDGDLDQRVRDIDYLIIDFMEERFDIIPYEGSYLTCSDALSDSSFPAEKKIARAEKSLEGIWEKSCLRFISFLKRFYSEKQIILVKSYLSDRYEDDDGEFVDFDQMQLPYSVAAINQTLNRYYDFFLDHYTPETVIETDRSLLYCENRHKHGVMPSHANGELCWKITSQMCQMIEDRKKLDCKGAKNEFIF